MSTFAVKEGKMTNAQADAMLEAIKAILEETRDVDKCIEIISRMQEKVNKKAPAK